MKAEKQFLVDEINDYLDQSEYVFLTDFYRLNVDDTAELRSRLAQQNAQFHVIKNRLFKVAAQARNLPDVSDVLTGQTAIVTGGDNPSEVAKVLTKFYKDKEKVDVKVGVLGDKKLTREEVVELSRLPSMDELRAQLLGLLSQPAQSLVRVIVAVPQGMLNVLQARADAEGAQAG